MATNYFYFSHFRQFFIFILIPKFQQSPPKRKELMKTMFLELFTSGIQVFIFATLA